MNPIAEKLLSIEWKYAPKDWNAVTALEARIASAARSHKENWINYSNLVQGVDFCLPNIRLGVPFQIDTRSWNGFDQDLLGDYMGFISRHSYIEHQFFASCFGVGKQNGMPTDGFYNLMYKIGALTKFDDETKNDAAKVAFWKDQSEKAHAFYRTHRTIF